MTNQSLMESIIELLEEFDDEVEVANSFEHEGVLTHNTGLVVTSTEGERYHVTIQS